MSCGVHATKNAAEGVHSQQPEADSTDSAGISGSAGILESNGE